MSGRHLAFPFRIAGDGRTATPKDLSEHVRDEVFQLLLTNPAERPFVPSFGGGLRRMVFENIDEVTAGVSKATISQALARYLGERLEVKYLEVDAKESTLTVDLIYQLPDSEEEQHLRFEHSGS